MKKFRFEGNEIVRLKQDHAGDGLKVDDCGVVWGVYDMEPTLYEASFLDEHGQITDMMFEEQDVEEVLDIESTPFPQKLKEVRQILSGYEAKPERESETQ